MKNKATILVIVFLLLLGLKILSSNFKSSTEVVLGGKVFQVEVADTEALREKGLSGHKPLLADEGMLFVFPEEGSYPFWMKEMLFPIDIIWIGENFQITHLETSLTPETYPTLFGTTSTAKYVLEIRAGEVERLKIQVGDQVKIFKK